MVDKEISYGLARAYFEAVETGELLDELLTPDMQAWITTTGSMSKERYQYLVRLLGVMCDGTLRFTVESLTADEDRVVAEARSEARLINGELYTQTYVFVFRIRDGRIASVAEHYNALVAQDKLVPLMELASKRLTQP